jgi:hypothetical protein
MDWWLVGAVVLVAVVMIARQRRAPAKREAVDAELRREASERRRKEAERRNAN